jgi:hypothetical protein
MGFPRLPHILRSVFPILGPGHSVPHYFKGGDPVPADCATCQPEETLGIVPNIANANHLANSKWYDRRDQRDRQNER